MKITRISRSQVYDKLEKPFNPPHASDAGAKDAFYKEWFEVRSQLLSVLEHFGENNEYDEKDFNLGDSAMLSRGIGVTFTSQRMFKPEVLDAIHGLLEALKMEYEVNVIFQQDGIGQHDLFLSKNELLSQLPDKLHRQVIPAKWHKEEKNKMQA